MPVFDTTFSITAIIAFCALLSPILTTLINNHYQLKLKRIEINQLKLEKTTFYKRGIFENYLKYAGRCIQNPDNDSMEMYGETYFLAYTYAPLQIREKMVIVDRFIANANIDRSVESLEQLAPLIEEYLQKL